MCKQSDCCHWCENGLSEGDEARKERKCVDIFHFIFTPLLVTYLQSMPQHQYGAKPQSQMLLTAVIFSMSVYTHI